MEGPTVTTGRPEAEGQNVCGEESTDHGKRSCLIISLKRFLFSRLEAGCLERRFQGMSSFQRHS